MSPHFKGPLKVSCFIREVKNGRDKKAQLVTFFQTICPPEGSALGTSLLILDSPAMPHEKNSDDLRKSSPSLKNSCFMTSYM